jgi:protocatechuate 3,4-dioxygenase alpha subunit
MAKERLGQTPWQTVGPFFHYGLPWKGGADLVGDANMGARLDLVPTGHDLLASPRKRGKIDGDVIEISGAVIDGAGQPIADAMIEIWQANAAGRYAAPQDARTELPLDADFIGFGRASTDAEGVYRFRTIRPGRVPGPGNTLQSPHIGVSVFGRGLLKRLATRLYFPDAPENEYDPILTLVPPERRATLIAKSDGAQKYRFDIILQGEHETVFLDI